MSYPSNQQPATSNQQPATSNRLRYSLAAALIGLLAGCANQPCCTTVQTTVTTTAVTSCTTGTCATPTRPAVATPTKLTAVGYGNPGTYAQYTPGQQKLMAMRAAQVDAYRSLAEQVYGFRITGSTTVSAFATQSDSIRSYVDALIRGARVISMASIADGNFEATVELELSHQFVDCFALNGTCGVRSNAVPACVTPGCTASSVIYVSQ